MPIVPDTSPMPGRLVVGGIGASVALEISGARAAETMATLEHMWHRCLTSADGRPAATIPIDPEHEAGAGVASDSHRMWERTTQQVTRALIQARAGQLLMFHAGAVSHPGSGRSLVYVAASRTGKTTLSQVLGMHFGYLSDELVAVDDDLNVLPYPKPLSVRSPDGAPRREISPDELGLLPAHPRPRLAHLAILNRDPHHSGDPALEELDPFDAVMQLAPQMSSLGVMDRGLHQLAHLVDRTGPVLLITYAEAEALVPVAEQLLEATR